MPSNYYFSRTLFVANYDRNEKIRLMQGEAEKAFSKLFPGQSQQTNMPDNLDPAIPRLVFSSGSKQLTISQTGIQAILTFKSEEKSADEQLRIFKKCVKDLYPAIDKFLGKQQLKETAVILIAQYPRKQTNAELHHYLYDRFIKIAPLSELASLALQFGFKTADNYFVNIEATVYELRGKEFDPPIPATTVIQVSDIPVVERGIGVKLDINSRPQKLAKDFSKMTSPDHILAKLDEHIESIKQFVGLSEEKSVATKG